MRVEYSLTPLGWAATEMLIALADWAEKHWVDVDSARARYADAKAESSELVALRLGEQPEIAAAPSGLEGAATWPILPGVAAEAGEASRRRVVVADDDFLMREGLASLLERAGFEVVGQAGDGTELVELVCERRPDPVIVDIRMPPTHSTEGLDAARVIHEEFPSLLASTRSSP